jgi:thiol:disulfide interchange protein
MKNYLLIFAIVLIGGVSGFGQKTAPAEKVVPVTPAQKATVPVAEKFDPARDPVADLKEAVAKAKAAGKRIILDVGGEWCAWCHFLDNFFAKNADLMKLREDNFVWLKINMSRENENKVFLAAYPKIIGYPHLFVLESDGALLQSQHTNVLELDKSYDMSKMTEFLKKWAPATAQPVGK